MLLRVLLSTLMVATAASAEEKLLTTFEVINPSRQARRAEVVGHGFPFAKGALQIKDLNRLVVLDSRGRQVRTQFHVTERWTPDPSVRFLQVVFEATVRSRGRSGYELRLSEEPVPPPTASKPVQKELEEIERLFSQGVVGATVRDHRGVAYRLTDTKVTRLDVGPLRRRYRITGYHRSAPERGLDATFSSPKSF